MLAQGPSVIHRMYSTTHRNAFISEFPRRGRELPFGLSWQSLHSWIRVLARRTLTKLKVSLGPSAVMVLVATCSIVRAKAKIFLPRSADRGRGNSREHLCDWASVKVVDWGTDPRADARTRGRVVGSLRGRCRHTTPLTLKQVQDLTSAPTSAQEERAEWAYWLVK